MRPWFNAAPSSTPSGPFVNPVVALALAWVVGDGALTWRTAAAAGLVIGAVLLTRETSAHPRTAAQLGRGRARAA